MSMRIFCAIANGAIIFFRTSTGVTTSNRLSFRAKSRNLSLSCCKNSKSCLDYARHDRKTRLALLHLKRMQIADFRLQIVAVFAFATLTVAQESPPASPSPSASAASARNVRISFLPPPLEGTISLGVYEQSGQLVRVLHQEADLDEFTVGADALITKWDGKNDDGDDLPAGKYRARGYLIGHLKVED